MNLNTLENILNIFSLKWRMRHMICSVVLLISCVWCYHYGCNGWTSATILWLPIENIHKYLNPDGRWCQTACFRGLPVNFDFFLAFSTWGKWMTISVNRHSENRPWQQQGSQTFWSTWDWLWSHMHTHNDILYLDHTHRWHFPKWREKKTNTIVCLTSATTQVCVRVYTHFILIKNLWYRYIYIQIHILHPSAYIQCQVSRLCEYFLSLIFWK